MYVRTTTRKSGKGEVTYVQLAHNEWDPAKKASTTKVICSLGRADALDVAGIKRLVASITTRSTPRVTSRFASSVNEPTIVLRSA